MDLRTYAVIAAGCTFIVSTACAGTTLKTTARPPVNYTLPEIEKDCSLCHFPTRTEKVGALRKKLPTLCLECHRDRKAPAEHKVGIVPAMDVKGLPSRTR